MELTPLKQGREEIYSRYFFRPCTGFPIKHPDSSIWHQFIGCYSWIPWKTVGSDRPRVPRQYSPAATETRTIYADNRVKKHQRQWCRYKYTRGRYQHGIVVHSKIGERVTNILPWARRSFGNMARISLTGLERFDTAMWYTKGIFYALLHTRLSQALISIPITDLINAPVQHMLLQDNGDWQLQLATIQRYNEAGWLVLKNYSTQLL